MVVYEDVDGWQARFSESARTGKPCIAIYFKGVRTGDEFDFIDDALFHIHYTKKNRKQIKRKQISV